MSCRDEVLKAIEDGKLPPMSKSEAQSLIDQVEKIKEFVGERDGITGANFRQAVMDHIDNLRYERIAKAREMKENLLKLKSNVGFVKQPAFKGREEKAILGKLLGGELSYTKGGSRGAAVVAEGLHASRVSGLYTRLKDAGLLEVAEKGLIDADVAQEMYLIDHGRSGETKNSYAQQMAKILRSVTDSILQDKQAAGSGVRRAKGYVAKTTYDREKLLALGENKFKELVIKNLDRQKTFGAMSDKRVNEELTNIFEHIVSGDSPSGVFDAHGKNIAKEQALSRTLIYKDGNAWFEINKELGKGNLLETILNESRKAANQTAMMEAFGTNPKHGFERLKSEVKSSLKEDKEGLKRFMEQEKNLDAAFERAMGFSDIPGTSIRARAGRAARVLESIAKTGAAAVSTITDIAYSATRVTSQTTGKNIFGEAASQVGTFLSSNHEKRAVAGRKLGIMLGHFQSEVLSKYGIDAAEPGFLSKSAQMFQKINLMKSIDEGAAHTGAAHHAMSLAEHADKPFTALDERLRLSLEKYGFDAQSWELARRALDNIEGVDAITPEALRELPDDVVKSIFPDKKPNRAKFEVANNLLSLYGESANAASSRASPRVQHILFGTTTDDGSWGTFQRLLMQFKQPVVMNMRTAAETWLSNPVTRPTAMMARGDIQGVIGLMVLSTALGYAKIALKDGLAGKSPPSPTDPETAVQAMLNGGVAGIYGDLLFRELHRGYGASTASLIAGPVVSDSYEISEIARKAWRGEASWSDVKRKVWDLTPGHNLFYFKGAVDYLTADAINESLNPGYRLRMATKARQTPGLLDEHQEYFRLNPTRGR